MFIFLSHLENFPFFTTKNSSNSHVSVVFCEVPRFLPSPTHPHSLMMNSQLLLVSSFPQLPPPITNHFHFFISFFSLYPEKMTIVHKIQRDYYLFATKDKLEEEREEYDHNGDEDTNG